MDVLFLIKGTDFNEIAVGLLQITSKLKDELYDQHQSFEETFDIYVDGKISELLEAKEILDNLQCRLSQLFEQFEDHPALQQVSINTGPPNNGSRIVYNCHIIVIYNCTFSKCSFPLNNRNSVISKMSIKK